MRRGIYDNGANNNNVRIDGRNQKDPYVQAGVRNIHRDRRGNVISGTTAEGTKIRAGGFRVPSDPQSAGSMGESKPAVSRLGLPLNKPSALGNPSTPGLDRLAAMNSQPAGESFAATEKRKRQESAASGAFGKRPQAAAQNLADRKSLVKDMQTAGKSGLNEEMGGRATKLGVSDAGWKRAVAKIPQTGNIAAVGTPKPPAPAGSLNYGFPSGPSWKRPTRTEVADLTPPPKPGINAQMTHKRVKVTEDLPDGYVSR